MKDVLKSLRRIENLISLSLDDQLWTIDHLAAYFSREKRTVTDHIIKQSGFPKAIHVPGVAKPYWNSEEVKLWANSPRRDKSQRPVS